MADSHLMLASVKIHGR